MSRNKKPARGFKCAKGGGACMECPPERIASCIAAALKSEENSCPLSMSCKHISDAKTVSELQAAENRRLKNSLISYQTTAEARIRKLEKEAEKAREVALNCLIVLTDKGIRKVLIEAGFLVVFMTALALVIDSTAPLLVKAAFLFAIISAYIAAAVRSVEWFFFWFFGRLEWPSGKLLSRIEKKHLPGFVTVATVVICAAGTAAAMAIDSPDLKKVVLLGFFAFQLSLLKEYHSRLTMIDNEGE